MQELGIPWMADKHIPIGLWQSVNIYHDDPLPELHEVNNWFLDRYSVIYVKIDEVTVNCQLFKSYY